jgi:hypothetical protein
MVTLDPQLPQVLASSTVAAAMLILGRAKGLIDKNELGHCAACGRLIDRDRRCSCSG